MSRDTITMLAALVFVAGCESDVESERERLTSDTAAGVIDSAPGQVASALAVTLTDENVFAVLDTGYALVLQVDRLAQERARDARIKEFAAAAVSGNAVARSGVTSTAERLGVSPSLPDRDVIEEHVEGVRRLQDATGVAFDEAYIDYVLETREEMIDEIDDALEGGGVKQEAVRTFLQQVRTNLQAELDRAKQLRGA
jgi:predicted outer membrane protein